MNVFTAVEAELGLMAAQVQAHYDKKHGGGLRCYPHSHLRQRWGGAKLELTKPLMRPLVGPLQAPVR
jgi:hypothetical protein